MTHYLRFPDEDTFTQACETAGLTSEDEDGNTVIQRYTHSHAMRVIGVITETVEPAEYDDEGNVTKEAVTNELEGWHVNFKGDLPDAFSSYEVTAPETPREAFSGDSPDSDWPHGKAREKMVVSRFQAKAALHQSDLLEDAQAVVDSSTDPMVKLAWQEARFERTSRFIETMGEELGLSEKELDDLFTLAATIR